MNLNKKVNIIISIILGILMIVFIIYKIIDIQKEAQEDAVALTVKENVTVEFLSDVKVSDFIEELQGEIIDDYTINTASLGEKEVTFDYKSIRNKKKTKSYKINIIDTTNPRIYMDDTITIFKGDNNDFTEDILSGDDCDPDPERSLEGEYDINQAGSYNLKYVVRDASRNEEVKEFTLNVIDEYTEDDYDENQEIEENNDEEDDDYYYGEIKFADVLNNYKKMNAKIGIDVSEWQDEIDWKNVKQAGAEFAFIRVGYQEGFEGDNGEDDYFEKNIKEALNSGLKVGVYFNSYALTEDEAIKQAEWVYDKIKDYNLDLPVVFDWESWNSFVKCKLSFYDINHIAQTFINKMENYGFKGMLYSSKYYLERIWYADKFENVWLAHYTNETSYNGKFQFWQICDTGAIDGINGDVDIDIWYE